MAKRKVTKKISRPQSLKQTDRLVTLQCMLNGLGFLIADPTGYLGDSTLMAIKRFQHGSLKQEPTGELDDGFMKECKRLYTKTYKGRPGEAKIIHGRLIDSKDKYGVSLATVNVFTSERRTKTSFVGQATTDEHGWFCQSIDVSKAKASQSNLYFDISVGQHKLQPTAGQQVLNFRKTHTPIIIEVKDPNRGRHAVSPSSDVYSFQGNLQRQEFLHNHATGFLDEATAKGYKEYFKRLQAKNTRKVGTFTETITFAYETSLAPASGFLIKVGEVDEDRYRIPTQSHVTDASGQISVSYDIKERLPSTLR